jgi:molybdopterin converting factor small subunit
LELEVKVATILLGKAVPPLDSSDFRLELNEGADAGALLDALGMPPELVGSVIVNKRRGRLSDKLEDGDRVAVLPSISGG